jgi:hypothetical protein
MEDNTSTEVVQEAPEIQDQETLETALQEPVQAAEVEEPPKEELQKNDKVFGKYNSLDDAQKAFSNIQARATKAEQQLKELQKTMASKTTEEIKSMDYEKQIEFLLGKINDYEDFKSDLIGKLSEAEAESIQANETQAISDFVSKNPLLRETGLDEEFVLIATHPSMQEYTLESIYNSRIKPKLEKLMGTKISVKERKLVGTSKPEEKFVDVSKMTPKEYEKHRQSILSSAGIIS